MTKANAELGEAVERDLATVDRHYGESVFWINDGRTHRCGGAQVHPGVFLLWPICGQGDVPAGAGFKSNGLEITCEACIAVMANPSDRDNRVSTSGVSNSQPGESVTAAPAPPSTPDPNTESWAESVAKNAQARFPNILKALHDSEVSEDVGDLVKLLRHLGDSVTVNGAHHVYGGTRSANGDGLIQAADRLTSLSQQLSDRDATIAGLRDRRADETQEVVAALYKAWPDAEDIASDWPNGIIGGIEQIIAERDNERQRQDGMFPLTEQIWRQNVEARDADLAAMRERVERAEGLLAFYRDEWTVPPIGPREDPQPSLRLSSDLGRRARSYFTQGGET